MLAAAAFGEGRYAQAFTGSGSGHVGDPVVSFCKIDARPIRDTEPVHAPDALLLVDPGLLRHPDDVFAGLRQGGYAVVNSAVGFAELGLAELVAAFPAGHVRRLPANDLARRFVGRPLPGTALLGGLAALTRVVSLEAVEGAVRAGMRRTGDRGLIEGHLQAARAGFRAVFDAVRQLTDV
jgi:pyruvate ferredoxin oxidoreductase gamma subunit